MAERDEEAELTKVRDLTRYSRNIDTIIRVVSMTEPREVSSRRDWSTHRVAEALVGDDTGSIYLSLWDNDIDMIDEGQVLSLRNAYVKLFRGSMRLNLGRMGSFQTVEEAPFDEVNLDNNLSSKQFERRNDRQFGGRRYGGRGRRRY